MSDEKLEKILRSFSKLEANVSAKFADLDSKITKVQQVNTALLTQIEQDSTSASDHDDQTGRPDNGQARLNATAQSRVPDPTQGFHQVDSDALQRHFKVIKDSYSSVRLPDDLYCTA